MKKLLLRTAPYRVAPGCAAPGCAAVVCVALLCAAAVPVAAAGDAPAPAPAAQPADERGVVARVNGEPVYLEDLERQLQDLHEQVEPGQRPDFDVDHLVERLVNDTLLSQEARSLGLADEGAIPEKVEELRRELATKRLEREEVWKATDLGDDDVRALFERDYRRATLRVLTTYEKDEAESALARLREGADFADVVAEVSVDPYKLRGGLVEDIVRVDLQKEIADVAFEASPGAVLGPIRTSIGWSVVRVESFKPADPERWDGLKRQVADVLRFHRGQERKAALMVELRQKHPVRVDAEALAAVRAERQEDGRLLPEVDDPATVIATVGDHTVTAEDLQKALAWGWKGIRNEEAARAALPIVLDELVRERLLLAEAQRRGYPHSPEVERSALAYEKSLLVERYLGQVLGPQVEVDGEAMKAYYEEHLQSFNRPPKVHVSQITVESEEEARKVAAQVREGTDFAWLARRNSIDRFKESGGERGWMYPMPQTNELSDQLLAAEPGEIVGPIGMPGNWAILRVNSKEAQGPYPFQEVSGNVRSAVYRERFQDYIGKVLDKLRSRSEIEVDRAALDALVLSGSREMAEETSGHAGGGPGHGGGGH